MLEGNFYESIQGFLVDITGVLYNSGGNAINGSVEAVNRHFFYITYISNIID